MKGSSGHGLWEAVDALSEYLAFTSVGSQSGACWPAWPCCRPAALQVGKNCWTGVSKSQDKLEPARRFCICPSSHLTIVSLEIKWPLPHFYSAHLQIPLLTWKPRTTQEKRSGKYNSLNKSIHHIRHIGRSYYCPCFTNEEIGGGRRGTKKSNKLSKVT